MCNSCGLSSDSLVLASVESVGKKVSALTLLSVSPVTYSQFITLCWLKTHMDSLLALAVVVAGAILLVFEQVSCFKIGSINGFCWLFWLSR